MTLNGAITVILHYFSEFSTSVANHFKEAELRPYCAKQKIWPKESSFDNTCI